MQQINTKSMETAKLLQGYGGENFSLIEDTIFWILEIFELLERKAMNGVMLLGHQWVNVWNN